MSPGQIIKAMHIYAKATKEMKHNPNCSRWTQEQIDKIIKLREQGMTWKNIAVEIGESVDAIRCAHWYYRESNWETRIINGRESYERVKAAKAVREG
jgi:hypothetical protein